MYNLIMEWLTGILSRTDIDLPVICVRLILGFFLGGLIGIERERHRQPAGLKTHILICTGATLLMMLSIYVPQTLVDFKNGDPGRIAAQVVTGIGFLGAGAILRLGVGVRGITTAASIWVVAAIGLCAGAGMYAAAVIATVIVLFVLLILDNVEKKIFSGKFIRCLEIYRRGEQIRTEQIFSVVENYKIEVKSVDISQSFEEKTIKVKLVVKVPEKMDYKQFYNDLGRLEGVYKIDLGQEL